MFRLIDAPELNKMVQKYVTEYNNLNYDSFIHDFVKLVVSYSEMLSFTFTLIILIIIFLG